MLLNLPVRGRNVPGKMLMDGQWVSPDGTIQRFAFAFAEGAETLTVFCQKDMRWFAQRTDVMNCC